MDQQEKKENLKRRMTVRYVFALFLVACVIVTSYLLIVSQIHQNNNDAYIINISGMQRMLSQRIALFSREIHHAETVEEADLFAAKMAEAVSKMKANHSVLVGEAMIEGEKAPMSAVVSDLYFRDNGVDKQVREYTDLADAFLTLYEQQGLQALRESNSVMGIVTIARNGLLDNLNEVVFQYQAENEEGIEQFYRLETLFVAVALFLLLLEALFIFRPAVNHIVRFTRDLEQANTELIEFSYRISHDLRAPVISALGLGRMAQQFIENGNTEQAGQSIAHANSSLEKMDRVIEDVITLSKVKTLEQNDEPVDLKLLIDEALEKISSLPGYERLTVDVDVQLTEPVQTKLNALRGIIENLLSNAVKYADPNEDKPFVELQALREGGQYRVSIRDNGVGIPQDYHDKLFGMFQRFHPKQSFGSGLGLYIVKQNANILNGNIKYEPLRKGSCFELVFPV